MAPLRSASHRSASVKSARKKSVPVSNAFLKFASTKPLEKCHFVRVAFCRFALLNVPFGWASS
jgi:hypothetical protein